MDGWFGTHVWRRDDAHLIPLATRVIAIRNPLEIVSLQQEALDALAERPFVKPGGNEHQKHARGRCARLGVDR